MEEGDRIRQMKNPACVVCLCMNCFLFFLCGNRGVWLIRWTGEINFFFEITITVLILLIPFVDFWWWWMTPVRFESWVRFRDRPLRRMSLCLEERRKISSEAMIWHLHARVSRRIPFGWGLLHVTIDIRRFQVQILWRLGGWESDKVGWDLGTDPVNIFFRMPSMLLSKVLVIWFFLNSLFRKLDSKAFISSYK